LTKAMADRPSSAAEVRALTDSRISPCAFRPSRASTKVVTTSTGKTATATTTKVGSNTTRRVKNTTMVTQWVTVEDSPDTSRVWMASMSPDRRVSRSPSR